MNPNEIVVKVADALDSCAIPFMVVGSFSSNLYGVERTTQDVDIVMQLEAQSISRLIAALGPEFRFDAQMGFETVTMTSRYIASHVDPIFKVELFFLSDDPHDREHFARRRSEKFGPRTMPVASAEDVIVTKLRWSKNGRRTKDIDDVRYVLAVQAGNLDMPYIRHWCDAHGTRELLEKTLSEIPNLPP